MSKQPNPMPPKDDGTTKPELDLIAIERRTYAAYHGDGLEEISAGIFVVGISLMMATNGKPWIIQLALIPMIPVFIVARQRITYPRIGYMKASIKRDLSQAEVLIGVFALLVALAVLLLIALLTWHSGMKPQAFSNLMPSLLGLYFTVPAAILIAVYGWLTGIARWYAYSALTFACLTVAWLLHVDLLWGLGCAGVLILLSGSVVLWRFIRSQPVLKGEIDDDSQRGSAQ